jgi:hypothetical protein
VKRLRLRAARTYRASRVAACIGFLAAIAACGPALATADGPDFYRVQGVSPGDALNLRAEPSVRAPRIAAISSDGQCLRNLGCRGGLTFQEFSTLSEVERKRRAEANPRWCKVEFEGKVGWVAGRYLAEGPCGAPAAQ